MVAGSEIEGGSTSGDVGTPTPAPAPPEPEPEEEEEEELEILESAPVTTFLYGSFELTTPKRKRIQVLQMLFLYTYNV